MGSGDPGHRAIVITWHVDDRRPTLRTRVYLLGMRLARDKRAFEGERRTLRTARRRQDSGDRAPTRRTRLAARVATWQTAGMTVWRVRPRLRRARARVVYLHGGGYVHPLTADYWRLVRALVRGRAEVVLPAYPLAPDATVDDVLPRLIEVATTDDDLPTVLMGDSAGGALVLVLARALRDRGGPMPAAVVALSPWLDAALADDEVGELEASDPMLAESGLRAAGRWWAGRHSPADPLVSPIHGDLVGLPPLEVFIGDRDILRPGVDRLVERARADGAQLHVYEAPAMFHVWMTRAIPEGRRTRLELSRLVRERTSASRH